MANFSTEKTFIRRLGIILILMSLFNLSACHVPVDTSKKLVPIYALDTRDIGGQLQVSLEKKDLVGNGKFEQHIEVHYVSPEVAQLILKNPEYLDHIIQK